MKKRVIAIIPARGNSKRVVGKNLKMFAGKPLICWTIEAALKARGVDKVIISTDLPDIADLGRKMGASVPFLRPIELSGDMAQVQDVISHVLDYYDSQGEYFTHLILLQPTSPLRKSEHIDEALELLDERNAAAIVSVCPVECSPEWVSELPSDDCFDNFINKKFTRERSQDLPENYRLNGAIYLCEIVKFREHKTLHNIKNSYAYKMKREQSIDIDEEIDFVLAEASHYFLAENYRV